MVLGIRPERFVVGAAANAVDSHLKAKVDVYESLGAENAAAVDLDVPESILGRAGAVTEAVRAKLGDNADMWMNQAHSRFV